jgi:2-methylisocitrate lyase-like PEP mutase family enzyme
MKGLAERFRDLHVPGRPLVLFNVWDPGSARAVAEAGAAAIATGSWSVAAAFGYGDGQALPLDLALDNARRVAAAVDVPVTIDFEGGYAEHPDDLEVNVGRLIGTGAVGINFEDQVVGGTGLHEVAAQAERFAAIRRAADRASVPLFVNARTDLFLQAPSERHADLVDDALVRARAYAEAGASGFFVPGLCDAGSIERLCKGSPLPLNVMVLPALPPREQLAELGVARLSHGPGPYRQAAEFLKAAARAAFANG